MPTLSRAAWVVIGVVLLEMVLCVGDLALGPWGSTHWEELFNARAGTQFACGHTDAADALQYRTFCGGCTAEGLLAAPFFSALGPTVWVWKLVVLVFHLGVLTGGAWLLHGLVSAEAAIAFVALLAAAPGWYRELVHTGWGNHAESSAFPLLATALMAAVAGRSGWVRAAAVCVAGGIVGLGLWFGQTSAWALPMVAVGAVVVGRWLAPVFVAGLCVGLLPLVHYYQDKPHASDATVDWWTARQLAPPEALWDWLAGPWLRQNIWDPTVYGDVSAVATLYWAGLWALALWGGVRLVLPVWLGRPRAPVFPALFAPASVVVLIGVYVLRYDLWSNLPDPYVNGAFNLRYRTPLVPLLALCAASAVGLSTSKTASKWVSWGSVALLCTVGLGLRLSLWTEVRTAAVGLRVHQHAGWPDKTVPLGSPPQPLRRRQGRPTDVAAAVDWITAHEDPLADCRYDHIYELGRRVGIGAQDPTRADTAELARHALEALSEDALEYRFFTTAIARGLVRDDGEVSPVFAERLEALSRAQHGLDDAVATAAGRRASGAYLPEQDSHHLDVLDPRVWAGVCEGRGQARIASLTDEGLRAPRFDGAHPRALLDAQAGRCADLAHVDHYLRGAAFAWARYVGCLKTEPDLSVVLPGDAAPSALETDVSEAFLEGCRLYR